MHCVDELLTSTAQLISSEAMNACTFFYAWCKTLSFFKEKQPYLAAQVLKSTMGLSVKDLLLDFSPFFSRFWVR